MLRMAKERLARTSSTRMRKGVLHRAQKMYQSEGSVTTPEGHDKDYKQERILWRYAGEQASTEQNSRCPGTVKGERMRVRSQPGAECSLHAKNTLLQIILTNSLWIFYMLAVEGYI